MLLNMRRFPDSLKRALSLLGSLVVGGVRFARTRIPRPRLRAVRDFVVLTLVAAFTVFSCYETLRYETTDWRRLQRSMNGNSWQRQQGLASASSFDWKGVRYAHLVKQTKALPARRPDAIRRVQHQFGPEDRRVTKRRQERQREVRAEFKRAWASYRKYAWGQDALEPIGERGTGPAEGRGWAGTMVDALDSLWIMGLREEFDEAVAAVAGIDFGNATSGRVNVLETSVRHLGGLLAAYDLSGREVLLKKATEIGELIYAGFDTENGMPVDFIDYDRIRRGEGQVFSEGEETTSTYSSSPGGLSLELTHLSQLTGDPKFYNAIDKVMDVFFKGQKKTGLRGMWPSTISMRDMDVVTGDRFTLASAHADRTLYESLPKMYQLLGAGTPKYGNMSRLSLNTALQHVIFKPMVPDQANILMPGVARLEGYGSEKPVVAFDPESEHVACFAGGMYGLAGRLFDKPNLVSAGTRLTDGCHYAYRSFPSRIMPERLTMVRCRADDCPWDQEYWTQQANAQPEHKDHLPRGFTTAADPRYRLRGEAVESVFYMYRLTGEARFRDAAWDMFSAVRNGTRTKHANAAVVDVTHGVYPLPQHDDMESFWLSETLKYLYLIFSSPDIISLDDYVFNTQGHPFKLPK